MQIKRYKLADLNLLEDNPRIIDTYKFQTLVESLKDFPEMLDVRPLIVDEELNVLCGNMRYRAALELGFKDIPAKMILGLTEERKKELIIKDNISFGEWDDKVIESDFNQDLFNKWLGNETFDLNILNYEDLTGVMDSMSAGVKKAIQIEFGQFYEQAKELEREARKKNIYIGGLFLQTFKNYSDETN